MPVNMIILVEGTSDIAYSNKNNNNENSQNEYEIIPSHQK